MDPDVKIVWIIGRYYHEFDGKEYCAMITPNNNEMLSGKIDIEYIDLEERIKHSYSVQSIQKLHNIELLNEMKAVMLCKYENVYEQKYLKNIDAQVIQKIEYIIYSHLLNFHPHKWFLGSYTDDKRDSIYVFSISNEKNVSNTLNCMYNDKNIVRIKEYPSLKDKNYLNRISKDGTSNNDNENVIDNYVASHLLMLNKWKIRLFDIEKYEMIWILDKYNEQEEKGYCIVPTDEEIRKNKVIYKDENRIRIINRYNQKNCKIINNHGMKFDTVEKHEKFYIPYRTLARFDNKICILNVEENEITWDIDDPVYKQNNITFHTYDSDMLSNLLRLPIINVEGDIYFSVFEYFKDKESQVRINIHLLEIHILKYLETFINDQLQGMGGF